MKKNVIITGASGNLGKVTADKFLAEGYNIITLVSPEQPRAPETTHDLEPYGVDLTNEKGVQETIAQIVSKHQIIDAALLLVGGFAAGGIQETDGSQLKKMYSLNFETAYFTARPIFIQMLKQSMGGRIVLIGARPSLNPMDGKNLLAYSLSKSLLFKLAEYLNAEGAAKNVVTSVIVPSIIDTPANRKSNPTADFSSWVRPEEIAEAMAFITSEKGQALRDTVVKIYANS